MKIVYNTESVLFENLEPGDCFSLVYDYDKRGRVYIKLSDGNDYYFASLDVGMVYKIYNCQLDMLCKIVNITAKID